MRYYTKCGREFTKSTKAETTGYHIPEDDSWQITDQECAACPFPIDVKEGWPEQRHKRWECRAGSAPPNHTTEWRGSLDDKNTIQIYSLDVDLMERIITFAKDQPELSAAYNADSMSDCRRTVSVSCSSNKKGMAAKRELIDKFFPSQEPTVAKVESCRTCLNSEIFKKVNFVGSMGNCWKKGKTESFPIYIPDSKCKDFVPRGEPEDATSDSPGVKELCINCASCKPAHHGEGHPLQHMCYHAAHRDGLEFYFSEDCEACENFEPKEINSNEICGNCGYYKSKTSDIGNCSLKEITVSRVRPACDDYGPGEVDAGDEDLKEEPMEEEGLYWCTQDDCPFNDREGSCLFEDTDPRDELWEDDVVMAVNRHECKNEVVVSEFNRIVEEGAIEIPEPKKQPRIGNQGCQEMREDCPCFCKHNDGCAVLLSTGGALKSYIRAFDVDCDVFREKRNFVNKSTESESVRKPKCPYLGTIGEQYVDCVGPHARRLKKVEFDSTKECRDKTADHCFDRFMDCEDYLKYYEDPISWDGQTDFRVCVYCCNSSGYLGLPEGVDGSKVCFCQVKQEPVGKYTEPCEWFNRHPDWPLEGVEITQKEDRDMSISKDDLMTGLFGGDTGTSVAISNNHVELTSFDYSSVDVETSEFLQETANRITEIRIKSALALGKELKEAQDKLAGYGQGTFYKWFESIGLKKDMVYRNINAYEWIVSNCDNHELAENIQPSLLFEVSKPSAPPELQQEVIAGNIKKHKDYVEALKRIKRAEEALEVQKTIESDYRKRLNKIEEELADRKDYIKTFEAAAKVDRIRDDTKAKEFEELTAEVNELREQLAAKPIEVSGIEIKEVIPEELENAWAYSIESAIKLIAGIKSTDFERIIQVEGRKNPEYMQTGYSELVDQASQNIGILSRYLRRK